MIARPIDLLLIANNNDLDKRHYVSIKDLGNLTLSVKL